MGAAPKLIGVDLFCGGGGTSKGFALACEEAGIKNVRLIAINHWKVAIETHAQNHPWAEHHCARVDQLDPRKLVPGGRVNILVASPECTNHANARGGRPINDQSRATAWDILKWLQELYVENLLIENVREIMDWGPLGADGRALKSKRGEIFQVWVEAIRRCGYRVDYRILNAADFGDATTRKRFFLLARRGTRKIAWPEQTHAKDAEKSGDLFRKGVKPWRAAREIIDWTVKGTSIYRRAELGLPPLSKNTLRRIEAGLRKFGGAAAEPFIVMLRGTADGQIGRSARPASQPLPTITAEGRHLGLCEPFILQQQSGGVPRSTKDPLPTIAGKGAQALVEPFIVGCGGPRYAGEPQSVDKPLGSVLTRNHRCLVTPFIVQVNHGTNAKRDNTGRVRSVEDPLTTVTGYRGHALVEPFLVQVNHGKGASGRVHSVDQPLKGVTSKNGHGLVEPFIVPFFGERPGQAPRTHSVDRPLPAVTSHGAGALVEPFVVKYHGTGRPKPVSEPLSTLTAKPRHGLVEPRAEMAEGGVIVDILFRMLRPRELARAMGFEGYEFKGKQEDQIRMIGNAVPVNTAKALVRALLKD